MYDLDYFIAKVNTNVLIDNPGQLNYTSIEISATVGVVDGDQVMVIQYPGRNRQCISHSTVVGSIGKLCGYNINIKLDYCLQYVANEKIIFTVSSKVCYKTDIIVLNHSNTVNFTN